jgi:glutamate N-acetyltransferase/amino-acid N-acetyltransferase
MTLLISDGPATAVGVFTTNKVCAAPVQVDRKRVPSTTMRGIVVNSGNANACTGEQGIRDAEEMTAILAKEIGCSKDDALVCSTGIIGRPLPMEKIREGIGAAFQQLDTSDEAFDAAAHGIMTTDTCIKTAARTVKLSKGEVRIVGLCKGAAMIGPNMATMLGFVLTDAKAPPEILDPVLRAAVDKSFHCISVEGHMSTNDTVLLLANGASGVAVSGADAKLFEAAVAEVCMELAQAIARDAEEASHLLIIDVQGTATDADARKVAKTVADSALVKTAVFGNDPNWGRICSAAGYAGIDFKEEDLSLRVNGTLLYDKGAPTNFDGPAESAKMKANRDVHIELVFTLGKGHCRFWTCDLTDGYVRFNADYTT